MGKRIRKKWDLPWETGGALVLLSASFFLGGAAGCLFAGLSGDTGAAELSHYLVDYLSLATSGSVVPKLIPVLWSQLKYLLAVLLLGFTALGSIGIPLVFALRGFYFSFSVACFVCVFGSSGLIPAAVLFGLPALLWGPALFLAGTQGVTGALQLLRRVVGDARGPIYINNARLYRAGLCVGLTVVAALLEIGVIPVLLRAAARVVL